MRLIYLLVPSFWVVAVQPSANEPWLLCKRNYDVDFSRCEYPKDRSFDAVHELLRRRIRGVGRRVVARWDAYEWWGMSVSKCTSTRLWLQLISSACQKNFIDKHTASLELGLTQRQLQVLAVRSGGYGMFDGAWRCSEMLRCSDALERPRATEGYGVETRRRSVLKSKCETSVIIKIVRIYQSRKKI